MTRKINLNLKPTPPNYIPKEISYRDLGIGLITYQNGLFYIKNYIKTFNGLVWTTTVGTNDILIDENILR